MQKSEKISRLLRKKRAKKSLRELVEENIDELESLGIDLEGIYGCGYYGCAFPTEDPHITAKITKDKFEMNYYILSLRLDNPILPKVFNIIPFPDSRYNLVFREAVTPMPWKEVDVVINGKYVVDRIFAYLDENAKKINDILQNNPKFSDLKSVLKKAELTDINDENIGMSVIDNRIILFDGQLV